MSLQSSGGPWRLSAWPLRSTASPLKLSAHRFTFRHTRRTVPITFSMILVQASERRSSFGNLSRRDHGKDLVDAFQDRASDTRPVAFETMSEVPKQLLSLIGVV